MIGKSLKLVLWIFVIIIIGYALYMTYRDVSKNYASNVGGEGSKAERFEEPKLKICLIYALWCPHCEKYLDSNVFMNVNNELKRQPKYDKVVFEQIDFEKDKKLVEKYDVSGFPSIVAVHSNGKVLGHFQGDRFNKNEIIKFVDQNLSKL